MTHDELRKLAEGAVRGPWIYKGGDGRKNQRIIIFEEIVSEYSRDRPLVTISGTAWKPAYGKSIVSTAAYIAAVHPQQIIALLDEISSLKTAVEDAKKNWRLYQGLEIQRVLGDQRKSVTIQSEVCGNEHSHETPQTPPGQSDCQAWPKFSLEA